MGKIIPNNIETKIVHAFFSGLQRDETVTKYGISEGKVSSSWTELKKFIGPEGVALRDLAIELKKNKTSAIEAKKGTEIVSIFEQIGMNPDETYSFIENVYSRSKDQDYPIENIIEDCKSLNNLEKEYGESYKEIKTKYELMGSKIKHYNKEINILTNQVDQLKKIKTNLWEQHNIDKENLEHYKKMKDTLSETELDMNNFDKVAAVISAIKEENYDIVPIINKLKEIENLEDKKYLLNEDIKTLNNETNKLEQNKQEITTKISTLEKSYETRINQITRYHNLLKKGATDEQIIFWEKIITSTNLNPKRIEEELLSQQNLILSKEEIQKIIRDLKQTEKELTASINILISNKKVIEESIETIQQTGIDKINETTESTSQQAATTLNIMNKTIEEIQNQTQEALKKSEIINQKILGKTETSVKNTADNLEKISKQINAITDETVNAIDKIGNLHPISDAYRFLDTGKGEPETVIPLAVNFLVKFKSWGKDRNKLSSSLEIDINHLMNKLEI